LASGRVFIDQIYTSSPSQGNSAPTFDEYALVILSHSKTIIGSHPAGN
jgi:hypothetical protein